MTRNTERAARNPLLLRQPEFYFKLSVLLLWAYINFFDVFQGWNRAQIN
jgi:hypothetical protein